MSGIVQIFNEHCAVCSSHKRLHTFSTILFYLLDIRLLDDEFSTMYMY